MFLQVDCIVTTAGGVEEDIIKCLAPTYLGDFNLDGKNLRENGINRIGNLLVPNSNYCLFEDWLMPKLDAMLAEQKDKVSYSFLWLELCIRYLWIRIKSNPIIYRALFGHPQK